jgi:tetraacyldisaccharide 4'-kinase
LHVAPDTPARDAGDEPLLLARRGAQVWVGPTRALVAELAVGAGADVLLLDDGLQHHALERDLDVIVADATNPLGNGAVLPQGPLRELPSALRRVRRGLLWLTHCDRPRHPRVAELASFPAIESAYVARGDLRGQRVFVFAGIARPDGFLRTVLDLGATVVGTRWFGDHHFFTQAELRDLRRQDGLLVTTEKDLVRIPPRYAEGIVAVPIDLHVVRGEDHLDRALHEVL